MIKPRKVFFMAIDGVAPRAKMNQQRGRRFRSAKEAETREAEAKQKGEKLPEEARFDSNCITPGTEFMDRLHQHLKYFVTNKLTNDDLWRDVKVVLSGHETPGEGEHKIMDFIRHEKSQPNYDPNTRHCLYGLDADLIMLGMCSHEPHFSLLREEVKYIRSKNDKKNQRDVNPEAITFHLLHLSLFREYIDHEFSELKTTLSFPYNLENIIDDWVLMGFLVGNDFIPHIPHFHINKSSLLKLYSVYKKVLPTLDGYLNENGFLNLHRFQKYLNELSNIDIDNFNDINADLKYFESKTGRKLFRRELEDTSAFFETNIENNGSNVSNVCDLIPQKEVIDLRSDSEDNEDYHSEEVFDSSDSEKSIFMEEFKSHKRDYYMSKLNYSHVNEAVLKEQAHQYIRAIQWNLHYYYNGCMSWGWFYPHHYAPYISDVNDFSDIDLNFEMGEPFKPFEQLLAVLPSASKALLPKAFEDLVTNSSSPLIDYYPEDFETDQNEKQQTWEAVVLIPFIDEKRLLEAVKKLEKNLTKDEMRRNTHGPHLIFTYSEKTVEPMVSPNPSIMPNITVNHAKCETLDPDAFRLPINRIHKGLCDGVKLDVYFPGFPTLRHIPHEAVLKKERVRVFESASLGENMILIIQSRELYDIEYVVNNYLGKSIFVNWPHLVEAKVFQVSNADLKYFIGRNGKVSNEDIEDKEFQEISIRIKSITKKYKERWGVIVGEPQIILHVHPLTGRKYVHGIKGKVTLEKQWSIVPMLCPIQTVVKDIAIFDQSFQQYKTVDQIYPKGAKCFLIDNPYYGAMAKVIDYLSADGLVKVEVFPQLEPDLSEVRDRAKEIVHEKYMPNYFLAQRLGISGHLLSRITGTIFIKPTNSDQRKINIGLNLKFNAKNEEIPGYSIKRDDTWLFSDKIFKIMEEYLTKFPFLFEKLSTVVDKDVFSIDDLIPGEQK
jgi:5'-3' exoribonuclease 1